MSIEADGGKPDFPRWWAAISTMKSLSIITAKWAEKLNQLLREVERTSILVLPPIMCQQADFFPRFHYAIHAQIGPSTD